MKEKEYMKQYYKEDSVELKSLLTLIWRSKFIILAVTIICTAGAVWYAGSKPKTYTTKTQFIQEGSLFMSADHIAKSQEFEKNLSKSQVLRDLYIEKKGVKNPTDVEVVNWAKSLVTVSAENLSATINDYAKKITLSATADSEKQLADLVNVYKNTLDATMTEGKDIYYDKRIKDLERRSQILKEMNASEVAYAYTVDEIARVKLERENVKLLSPLGSLDKIDEVAISKKKYVVMGFGGGLILSLAAIFLWDLLKDTK